MNSILYKFAKYSYGLIAEPTKKYLNGNDKRNDSLYVKVLRLL